MRKFTEEQIRIYKKINDIIWEDWNPIGLSKEESPNEYDGYLGQLFSLKIKGVEKLAITEYLFKTDKEIMGIDSDKQYCEKIAEKIINI